jgi:hypothetical protein
VGMRGRNRAGLYVALMYALDLHFELECSARGSEPDRWQPRPRKRPDHFCFWALDTLETLGVPAPPTFPELLVALKRMRLPSIARMLDYTMTQWSRDSGEPVATLYARAQSAASTEGDRSSERHPQVRKFAKQVCGDLDAAWLEAIELVEAEFAGAGDLPRTAFLLGALPPGFSILNRHVFGHLGDVELVLEHSQLTAFQFYGLVVGSPPPAPARWARALDVLAPFDGEEIAHLASLSARQLRSLQAMGAKGKRLLDLRRSLGRTMDWMELGEALRQWLEDGPDPKDRAAPPEIVTRAAARAGLKPQDLAALSEPAAWQAAARPDDELLRLLDGGSVGHRACVRIGSWPADVPQMVADLFESDRALAVAFLEDRRILDELFTARTSARLSVRDLFPKTIERLDAYLLEDLAAALIHDVGDLESVASVVSHRIKVLLRQE